MGKDTARLYNCKRVCFRKDRKLALTACQRGPVVVRAFLVLHEREDGRDKDEARRAHGGPMRRYWHAKKS